MTRGRTKGVDILVSDPDSRRMWKIEVKTNYRKSRERPTVSRLHGRTLSSWIMQKKHETISDSTLFYCFVNIGTPTNVFKFYIVPSAVVARYVKDQHAHWLRSGTVKDSDMRIFRIGKGTERYSGAPLRSDPPRTPEPPVSKPHPPGTGTDSES